jgi:hypothetical protein
LRPSQLSFPPSPGLPPPCRARCQRLGVRAPRLGGRSAPGLQDPEGSGLSRAGPDKSKLDLAPKSPSLEEPLTHSFGEDADLVGYSGVALPLDPERDEAAEASRVAEEEQRRVHHLPRSDTLYSVLPYREEWRFKVCALAWGWCWWWCC